MTVELSQDYADRYVDMIHDFVHNADEHDKYTNQWPVIGREYLPGHGLLVLGRAPNGWGTPWPAKDLVSEGGARKALEAAREEGSDVVTKDGPLSWVVASMRHLSKYNANRSAFWRVTRDFAHRADLVRSPDWAAEVAYSNIYKVAPDGENPSSTEARWQLEGSKQLLGKELKELSPVCVLVLAGADWYGPFADTFGQIVPLAEKNVHGVVRGEARVVLCADHPQSRKEKPFVDDLIRAFREGPPQ